jgi:positive regulator of sigma E activity
VRQILEFLTSASVMDLAADPRVLFAAAALFVLAALFRWKYVLLFLFGIGGFLTVIRYSHARGGASIDDNLVVFSVGTLAVAVVLIYFLFIRGD